MKDIPVEDSDKGGSEINEETYPLDLNLGSLHPVACVGSR
jgi:hypothetical protein